MKTKKSNMIMLGILLVVSLILVLTSCKKKVQSANAPSSETSSEEQESMQFNQSEKSFSYLQSEDAEDEEPAEDPNEYPEEEPNEEPNDEPNEPDEEPNMPQDDPNDEPNWPEEGPNESPEEPNEEWLQDQCFGIQNKVKKCPFLKKGKGTTKPAEEAVEEFEDTELEEDVNQSEDFEF